MKRLPVFLVAVTITAAFAPAHAGRRDRDLSFDAPVPCSAVCSYWLEGDPAACSAPGPEGSYADVVVQAPRRTKVMSFTAAPDLDWDLFVCSPGGKLLAWSYEGLGADEEIWLRVVPGRRYVLRAYNFSDVSPLPARVAFHA